MKVARIKMTIVWITAIFALASLFSLNYSLAAERVTWNQRQLGRIPKEKKEFSFVFFGDHRDSGKIFDRLVGDINGRDILFVIDGGDLVNTGEKKNFKFFMKQAEKVKAPLLTVPGNHDVYFGGRKNYVELFGPLYYSFSVGESYFITLDDNRIAGMERAQFDWLVGELKKSQAYRYRFVFMHIPLYDPRYGNYGIGHSLKDPDQAKKLNLFFDKYNVTMLFTSHIHGYFKGRWGKTPYIISGGAGAMLAGFNPAHFFYHYIKVSVSPSGVDYEVIKF